MKRAAVIYNPQAGRDAFASLRDAVVRMLAAHGFEAAVHATTAEPDSARTLAHEASRTADLVLACGGDGTVHGVVQGLAGSEAVLGVLPFGTANALARNLLLPVDPLQAIETLLQYQPQSIPLGRVASPAGTRWFTVMAGAGPDGRLVHEMQLAAKARVGRRAYYTEAALLFLTRRFPAFQVEYREVGSSHWEQRPAVAVMASRVADLGGLFSGLTRASRLHHPHLQVQLLRAPAHLAFPAWLASSRLRLERTNPWLTSLDVEEVRCTPLHAKHAVYAQVDGEAFGVLPLAMSIVPKALRLLMPKAKYSVAELEATSRWHELI